MTTSLDSLLASAPVVTDGAWGTQLQARGLPIGACPDAWNVAHPERVEDVARAYVDAGSRVILTNTFGATRLALERHGLADRAAEVNEAGARISRSAAGDRALVFASMGPCGKMVSMREVEEDAVLAAYREQAQALAAGGAQGFVVETMSDLAEAALAVRAGCECGLPVVACMVFDAGRSADRTMMGVTPEQAAEGLAEAGASVLGSNCGKGPEQMLPVCERMRAATGLPLWLKPNAGMPSLVDGQAVYTMGPDEFASLTASLAQAGAAFLGGCCGTSPDYIPALSAALAAGA